MEFKEVESSQVPFDLLLEADPSKASISSYLYDSWCFVACESNEVLGVCVVKPITSTTVEIFNVSVQPSHQRLGIGTKLLKSVLTELPNKGVTRIELGTGTFGYQLTYYQRLGFRVDSVSKDYFLINYSDPIFEAGIQHKDMLRLYINL